MQPHRRGFGLNFFDGVKIVLETKEDPEVFVDPVKMSIAIKNLIENAYKYADSNEKINADPIFVSEGDLFYDEVIEHYIIESSENSRWNSRPGSG